ncbi:MAG: hypothetical protein CL878_01840 [Dehalococcoidia bacterium]|nr:hypothetical protein [Dehalococcoidia bacterium]
MRWFKEQLAEIGYVEHEGGLYATPPTEAPGLILGDAIEIQLRSLLISRVFPVDVTQEQREEGVEWSGQAVVTFEYRDRYHRSKESRPWSEWAGDFWVLTLARSEDQWTIRRTS